MKKTLAVLLSLCLLLPCLFTGWTLPASAATVTPGEITGAVEEGYRPATAAVGISSLAGITDLKGNYYLTADITENTTMVMGEFSGTFDGCGYTVTSTVPLFEYVFGGTVKNLVVEGNISSAAQTGAVARFAAGATFSNIWNKASVQCSNTAKYITAGIAAGARGGVTFENCRNSGAVTGNGNQTGGICAYQYDMEVGYGYDLVFRNCVNEGVVSGGSDIGGIFGCSFETNELLDKTMVFENCVNTASVTGSGRAGGIAGVVGKATATDCRNSGAITSTASYAAGIFGRAASAGAEFDQGNVRLIGCRNDAKITSCKNHAGGMVGYSQATIAMYNCSNTENGVMEITSGNGTMGGLVASTQRAIVAVGCSNAADLVPERDENGTIVTSPNVVGGIVGEAYGKGVKTQTTTADQLYILEYIVIEDCKNTGDLEGKQKVGGIIGRAGESVWFTGFLPEYRVTHCLNTGNITVNGNGSTTDHSSNTAAGIVGYAYGNGANGFACIEFCASYGNVTCKNTTTAGNAAYFLGYTNSPQAVIRYNIGAGTLTKDVGTAYPIIYNNNGTVAAEVRDNFLPEGQFESYSCDKGTGTKNGAVEYTEAELSSGALVVRANTAAGIKEAFYQVLGTDARPVTVKSAENAIVKADADTYVNTTEGDVTADVTTETDERGYTLIKNEDDFANMNPFGNYVLANNITVNTGYTANCGFFGELDGNGMTVTVSVPMFTLVGGVIYNLTTEGTIPASASGKAVGAVARFADGALFANITNKALLTNTTSKSGGLCGVINAATVVGFQNYGTVTAANNAGAVCGLLYAAARIVDAHNFESGAVTGKYQVGGLVGFTYGAVVFENCENDAKVTCTDNYAGGLLGRNHGEIGTTTPTDYVFAKFYNCKNTGEVVGYNQYVGGFVGYSTARIYAQDCVNTGKLSTSLATNTVIGGGMIAAIQLSVTLKNCVNEGEINLPKGNVGGLVAKMNASALCEKLSLTSELIGCRNSAPLTAPYGSAGLVARTEYGSLTMTGCVNEGTVTVNASWAGGVIGTFCEANGTTAKSKNSTLTMTGCVNSGAVTATSNAGGVGVTAQVGKAIITDCRNSGDVRSTGGAAAGMFVYLHNGVTQVMTVSSYEDGTAEADTTLHKKVGKIEAVHSATLEGCTNTGAVSASENAAGLIGSYGCGALKLNDCRNEGDITTTNGHAAGMVVDANSAKVTQKAYLVKTTNADESVTVTATHVKIPANTCTATFTGCTNAGTINAAGSSKYAAGIIANYLYGKLTVNNCLNLNHVTSASASAAGIVVNVNGSSGSYYGKQTVIRYSGNTGNIEGKGNIGGIQSYQYGNGENGSTVIEYCFTIGTIKSNGGKASGILGYSNTNYSQINYCYGAGEVIATTATSNSNPNSNAVMWNNKLALKSCEGNVFAPDFAKGYITEKGADVAGGAELFDNSADYVFAVADMASGALAVRLNALCGSTMWTQTLGTDEYPMANVTGGKVVTQIATAEANGADLYTNGFIGVNVNAGSDLVVRYYFTVSGNVNALTTPLNASMSIGGKTVTVPSTEWSKTETAENSGIYSCVISCTDVTPQSMGENIVATLGSLTGDTYSVKSYLLSLIAMDDAKMNQAFGYAPAKAAALRTLAADLIVYGAAAQAYIGYQLIEAPIMDAATEKAIAAYRSEGAAPEASKTLTNNGTGATFKGASVLFDNKVKLAFRLTDIAEGAVVKIGVGGAEIELTDKEVTENGTYYYTPAISPNAYGTVYTVTVYVGGAAGAAVTYGVNMYAAAMQNSANSTMSALAVALYHYGAAAAAFNA